MSWRRGRSQWCKRCRKPKQIPQLQHSEREFDVLVVQVEQVTWVPVVWKIVANPETHRTFGDHAMTGADHPEDPEGCRDTPEAVRG